MRRRSKRGPNNSESTGRIGQEIPANQPAPLQPSYGSDQPRRSSEEPHSSSTEPKPSAESGRGSADPKSSSAEPKSGAESRSDNKSTQSRPPSAATATPTKSERPSRPSRERGRRDSTRQRSNPGVFAEPIGTFEDTPSPADDLLDGDADGADFSDAGLSDADFSDAYGSGSPSGIEPPAPGEGKLVLETQPESPSQAPPEAQAARASRGFVVLAIGLPGSGKTTWFKRRGVTPLSSDMLRSILFDDITEQRYQGLVFSTLRSLLRARLIAKMPWNYVDATNLSPHERRQWIKMAKSFGYEVQAVFFDVPFEVCMERNHRRERVVSDDTMQKMAERLRPPNFKEGFNKITVVRVKGSAGSGEIAVPGPDEAAGEEPASQE